ncbi:MAG: hypothetical protein ABSG32_18295 [Terriglobia bacterium]|jgi:hypothetical protein
MNIIGWRGAFYNFLLPEPAVPSPKMKPAHTLGVSRPCDGPSIGVCAAKLFSAILSIASLAAAHDG